MFEEEVARGAMWLDRNEPVWENNIDVKTLNLDACSECILGQLRGSRTVQFMMSTDPVWIVNHGFAVAISEPSGFPYKELTAQWIKQIMKRRVKLEIQVPSVEGNVNKEVQHAI